MERESDSAGYVLGCGFDGEEGTKPRLHSFTEVNKFLNGSSAGYLTSVLDYHDRMFEGTLFLRNQQPDNPLNRISPLFHPFDRLLNSSDSLSGRFPATCPRNDIVRPKVANSVKEVHTEFLGSQDRLSSSFSGLDKIIRILIRCVVDRLVTESHHAIQRRVNHVWREDLQDAWMQHMASIRPPAEQI